MESAGYCGRKGKIRQERQCRGRWHTVRGIRHRTAHVWIFRRRGGVVQILLQKRSDNKDSDPAVMTFQVPVIFLQGVIIFLPRCGS